MEITQTARVYVKYGETLAFGLCNLTTGRKMSLDRLIYKL